MLLISDANILIDFDCCGLLPKLFQLSDQLAVPDVLFVEELQDRHPELPEWGLQVLEINGGLIAELADLKQNHPKPGTNDLLALILARARECPLITGDAQLRVAAKKEHVTVYGSLWIADRLVRQELIGVDEAEQAFEQMKQQQRRLPWDKVARLITRLRAE